MMEQYLHKLYMHYEIMPMTLSMETPYNACVFMEYVNGDKKKYRMTK